MDKRLLSAGRRPYRCAEAPPRDAGHVLDDAIGETTKRGRDCPAGRLAGELRLPGALPMPTLPRTPGARSRLASGRFGRGTVQERDRAALSTARTSASRAANAPSVAIIAAHE